MTTVIIFTLFVLFMFSKTTALFEGDDCVMINSNNTLQSGKCTDINKCDFAKTMLRQKQTPQTCGFNTKTALVCCPVTLNKNAKVFSTEAEKKCSEYYKDTGSSKVQVAHGIEALPREFPHMAAIGYGNKKSISWLCGGSLVSERFVLTAAHCANSRNFGTPKWVRLGDLDLKNTTEDALPVDYRIISIIIHPDYRGSSHYNDIALLKLEKSVDFTSHVSPACLQTKKNFTSSKLSVTGWGNTDFLGEKSNILMKATVNIVSHAKCAKNYAKVSLRKLKNGIVDDLQICAGDESGRDTCPGDSGGPLQYIDYGDMEILPHYVVVGVTSFGKACGFENSCGVYSRVSSYIPWIESVAWPSSK